MGLDGGLAVTPGLLRETLTQGGKRAVITVASNSMEPVLREGDRITIEGADPSRLRRGDIVVYESPLAGLVVHRLMWKVPPFGEPRVVFTKGDALPYLDRPVAVRGLLGRVVEIESGGARSRRRRLSGAAGYTRWIAAAAHWGWKQGMARIGRKALTHRKKR